MNQYVIVYVCVRVCGGGWGSLKRASGPLWHPGNKGKEKKKGGSAAEGEGGRKSKMKDKSERSSTSRGKDECYLEKDIKGGQLKLIKCRFCCGDSNKWWNQQQLTNYGNQWQVSYDVYRYHDLILSTSFYDRFTSTFSDKTLAVTNHLA